MLTVQPFPKRKMLFRQGYIFVDNVISAEKLKQVAQTVATINTFDGLTITIRSADIDNKYQEKTVDW